MAEKPTRGRRSKVHLLPDEIKQQLDAMLRDGRLQQQEILDVINQTIGKAGLPTDAKLSRTGLNRYSTRMEAVGNRIRQAREVSQQWIARLGTEPEGDVSRILVEMIRTLAFELTMNASEGDDPIEPRMIKDLAIGVERLEKAASESQKREQEIRKQAAVDAAAAVERSLTAGGMGRDQIDFIKKEILGIAS
jgi:hypothetical protein